MSRAAWRAGGILVTLLMTLTAAACGGSSAPAAKGKASTKAAAAPAKGGSSGSAAGSTAAPKGPTVNIAMVGPFTGQFAAIGQTQYQGTQVAAYDINHSAGVLGRPVKVMTVDTKGDPVDAVPAVRQALATENIHLVVGMNVADYEDALPIVNAAHMVSFNYVGSPVLDHVHMKYSFRASPSDSLVGAAMAWYAKHEGYKRIALVFDAEAGAQALVSPIEHAAQVLGLNIVAKPSVPLGLTSYEPEILKVLQGKPDAILMQVDPSEAGIFFKQLKNLGGGTVPIIGSDLTAGAEWVKAIGPQEAQKRLVSITSSSSYTGPGAKYFVPVYNKLFHETLRFYVAHFYDAVNVGVLAMEAAHSLNPTVYVNSIPTVTTPGNGHVVCYAYSTCVKLLQSGKQIKYYGVGSPMTFNQYHNITGSFQAVKTNAAGKQAVLMDIGAQQLQPLIS